MIDPVFVRVIQFVRNVGEAHVDPFSVSSRPAGSHPSELGVLPVGDFKNMGVRVVACDLERVFPVSAVDVTPYFHRVKLFGVILCKPFLQKIGRDLQGRIVVGDRRFRKAVASVAVFVGITRFGLEPSLIENEDIIIRKTEIIKR